MALLGNYSVLHKSPAKYLTGTVAYGDRANWNKPGMMRSMGAAVGLDWTKASIPAGFGAFGAWHLPKEAGSMTSRRMARIAISASAIGALGRNMVASGLVTIDASAIGALIAGAVGVSAITISAAGVINAVVGGVGSATVTIGAVANTGAIGWLVGNGPVTIDASMLSYAIGWMTGTTDWPSGTLTADEVANAVWEEVAADHDGSGTMGEKLNDAGAAANPWTELLPGAYGAGTAGKIVGTATYMAKTWPLGGAGTDDYLMAWFKNGVPITSGITDATIQVIKASDGTDLVPLGYASEVGALGVFKFSTAFKMLSDTHYIIVLGAVIDGDTRTWYQPYGIE